MPKLRWALRRDRHRSAAQSYSSEAAGLDQGSRRDLRSTLVGAFSGVIIFSEYLPHRRVTKPSRRPKVFDLDAKHRLDPACSLALLDG
jgi:hypothetical protein